MVPLHHHPLQVLRANLRLLALDPTVQTHLSQAHRPVHLLSKSGRETEGQLIDTEGEEPKTKGLWPISIVLEMRRNGIDTRRVEEWSQIASIDLMKGDLPLLIRETSEAPRLMSGIGRKEDPQTTMVVIPVGGMHDKEAYESLRFETSITDDLFWLSERAKRLITTNQQPY
jgi:hypothetical protein